MAFIPDPAAVAIRPVVLWNGRWTPATYRTTRWDRGFFGDCGTFIGDVTFVYSNCAIDRQAYYDVGRATDWFVEHRGLMLPIRFFDGPPCGRKPDAPARPPGVARAQPRRPFLSKPPGVQDFEFKALEVPRTKSSRPVIIDRPRPMPTTPPASRPAPPRTVTTPMPLPANTPDTPTTNADDVPTEPPLSLGEVRAHLKGLVLDAQGLVDALTRTPGEQTGTPPQDDAKEVKPATPPVEPTPPTNDAPPAPVARTPGPAIEDEY